MEAASADCALPQPHADEPASACQLPVLRLADGEANEARDQLIAETPVALVYNGVSHAVLMATPEHLSDFALGFSLSEGILARPSELFDCEVRAYPQGVELRLEIAGARFARLKERRRSMTGRTGCGLCGVDSLAAVALPLGRVAGIAALSPRAVERALAGFALRQPLREATGAAHAAAWVDAAGDILLVREDVGRHNALDKLIGALARDGFDPTTGFALVSSRASYEMVQKAASAGIGALVAMSAATAYAAELAAACGMTLAGFARPGRLVVYSGRERIQTSASPNAGPRNPA
ncbi:sulfurtransferase FdhD [Xenophilus sp. AP218F]|nr:sulfurtransferase FdhD [Xenophilus sp. AP218F]